MNGATYFLFQEHFSLLACIFSRVLRLLLLLRFYDGAGNEACDAFLYAVEDRMKCFLVCILTLQKNKARRRLRLRLDC